MAKRVVVTGIGIVSPIGIGVENYWSTLLKGVCGIRPISAFDASGFVSSVAGQVPEYKIGDYVPKSYRKATKVMARDIELAVMAADEAFKNAGLKSQAYASPSEIDGSRFGCNIGAGLISAELDELTSAMHVAREGNRLDLHKWGSEGMQQLTPLWLLKYLPNMLACHVTIIHGLMGPSNTITCADASSHLAIGEAFRTIQRGKAELAICGGAESRVNPMGIMRYQLLNRLNTQQDVDPSQALRPFDTHASGTIVGEGGGLLILEEYEHAKSRGATIYAELVGFAASQDAYKLTEPDPTGRSYGKAVENALKDARLTPGQLDLLVPHGLGIPSHDRAELEGLKRGLGEHVSRVPVSAIKAQISQLGAGCGVDVATAVLSIHRQAIPPSLNTRQTGDIRLNVSEQSRKAPVRTVLTTVYSLGGQNAALVFKAPDESQ